MKRSYEWWYQPAFALILWCEATVILTSLGRYSPGWLLKFVAWHTLRSIREKP